jgi:DNA-damage-inducible protein J
MEVFSMASTIQLRVDDDLKKKSDKLFNDLGTDTTTAIRMFLTQALAVNGFPFEIKRISPNPYVALSESEMMEKLEKSREHASKEMIKEASEVSQDMRDRYGL